MEETGDMGWRSVQGHVFQQSEHFESDSFDVKIYGVEGRGDTSIWDLHHYHFKAIYKH